MARRMIFHAPYPLAEGAASASRLRPVKMRAAFQALGYDVLDLSGTVAQRKKQFALLKTLVAQGERFEFAYSENSTQPNVFATSIKQGLAPMLDARIFRFLKKSDIPFGQFYRDIYWRFPGSSASVRPLRRFALKRAYSFDLRVLRAVQAHIFLPSLEMASYVPVANDLVSALPPGTDIVNSHTPTTLRLFYVGGLGPHYQVHELVDGVRELPEVELEMVVPEQNWNAVRAQYEPSLPPNVTISHAVSDDLRTFYDRASFAMVYVKPDEYRSFAVPFKFFEALGHGKPVIATSDTLAGTMASDLGIGIALPYSAVALRNCLQDLVNDPGRQESYRKRAETVRSEHTWLKRAETVEKELMSRRP